MALTNEVGDVLSRNPLTKVEVDQPLKFSQTFLQS